MGLADHLKPCTQMYLQQIVSGINLQLAIRILKNHTFQTCTTPLVTFRSNLRTIGLLDIKLPRKEIVSTDDRRTYKQTSRLSTIDSFFKERKKTTKKL